MVTDPSTDGTDLGSKCTAPVIFPITSIVVFIR